MLAVVPSATLHGLDGRLIRVEVDVAPGLPGFTIVGLADTAVQEARERVRGAIRNAGFVFPPRRITVNLAPAELRKTGASLDLAMAHGHPARLGAGPRGPGGGRADRRARAGRRGPAGARASCRWSRRWRGSGSGGSSWPPRPSMRRGSSTASRSSRSATLAEAAVAVRGRRSRRALVAMPRVTISDTTAGRGRACPTTVRHAAIPTVPDLAEVRGQLEARRALEIALAGGHGMLMIGPPGVGKTLLARTIPGLLPPLDDAAALSVSIVASAAGEGPVRELHRRPPFRSPHHTLSYAAMVGGGPSITPGEITRADQGVLFLDELAEFDRDVLEALRQPLEEGRVVIARAGRTMTFPCRFQLVAAMNPCPCGFAGTLPEGRCRCTPGDVERYGRRVSGPLRDRIDLWVTMPRMSAGGDRRRAGSGGVGRRRGPHRGRAGSLGARSREPERPAAGPGPPAGLPAVARGGGPRRRPRRGRAGVRSRHGTAASGRAHDRRPRRLDERGSRSTSTRPRGTARRRRRAAEALAS